MDGATALCVCILGAPCSLVTEDPALQSGVSKEGLWRVDEKPGPLFSLLS